MSFSGVGAHHQNGIAEKRIRDLQDLARSMLIHAMRRWPDAINTYLWPYALRKANSSKNLSIQGTNIRTPMELFSNSNVAPNLRHEHPFGCPVYVLDRRIQGNMKAPKWESRGRLGIYLGTSEYYAKTVGLILSTSTGLVSPQFHLKFDDEFISVSPRINNNIPISEWQFKCGFLLAKTKVKYLDISNVPTIDSEAMIQHIPATSIQLPIQPMVPETE
jgi:hypothetical protein